ncbi:YopX family protein [Bacillus sp. TL12]|nr:YopX family protein [Bacillus sp. TL12]
MKDKNGKEIYEGDIVKISNHPFQGSIDIDGNYEVFYNEYMELSCGGWYLFRMRNWAEVIGNRFENPELLKGDGEKK